MNCRCCFSLKSLQKMPNQTVVTISSSAATQLAVLVLSLRAGHLHAVHGEIDLIEKSNIIWIISNNNLFIIGYMRLGKIIENLVLRKMIPWVHQQFYCCLQNGNKSKRQTLISCLDQFLHDFVRLFKGIFFSFTFTLNDFGFNLCLVLGMEVILLFSVNELSVLFTVFKHLIYSIWLKKFDNSVVLSQI